MTQKAKLDARNVIVALTVFIAIVYIVCGLAYMFFPEQLASLGKGLIHSIAIDITPLSWSQFFIGFIETIILSLIGSALFVWIYNKLAR